MRLFASFFAGKPQTPARTGKMDLLAKVEFQRRRRGQIQPFDGPSSARAQQSPVPWEGTNEPDEISDRVGVGCGRLGDMHDGRRR